MAISAKRSPRQLTTPRAAALAGVIFAQLFGAVLILIAPKCLRGSGFVRYAGDIVLVDSTNFTTLFGGTDSLKDFWHNLSTMR